MPVVLMAALGILHVLPQQAGSQHNRVVHLPKHFAKHTTPDYAIYSDLDNQAIREAALRMTKMAEEYRARTASFTRKATTRLPFYLFKNAADYYAAGGPPRSIGVYRGNVLMAVVGTGESRASWRIVQHEGWHQFVHRAMGGDIPVWVNEGMAGYFEDAIFTGDAFIAGQVRKSRLKRVQALIDERRFMPFAAMMTIHPSTWLHQMSRANYDQAWSMVYFLAHADKDRYQAHFERFLKDVSLKGGSWKRIWKEVFGTDVSAFEDAWKTYWLEQPDDVGDPKFEEAVFATLTSFLARAVSQGERFDTVDDFLRDAGNGKTKMHAKDWIPDSLLRWALRWQTRVRTCRFDRRGANITALVCEPGDGSVLRGSWTIRKGRVSKVSVSRRSK